MYLVSLIRYDRVRLVVCVMFSLCAYLRSQGVIVFGSDQEVGMLMQAVRRNNASRWFSWIGSDGWGGRSLAVDGNEIEV